MSELVTIGVDVSLTRTAIATLPSRAYAIIPTQAGTPLQFRLRRIAEDIYEFVAPLSAAGPVLVVMETPGFIPEGHSVEAIYGLGRAQGAALLGLPAMPNVRHVLVTPAAWRKQLAIKGGPAAKANVLAYMEARGIAIPRKNLGRESDNDVADAFGLAIYGTEIGEVEQRQPHPGIRRGRAR